MAQDDLVLYLVLTPEFGGTRFGPFEGLEARLGSNRERSHITLPESLGVAKEHCKVIRQGGANMILAPSERTAAVFLWKGDARRPVQVQTPTAVKPGDSFSLVTPEGPRFIIELGELPAEVKAQRATKGPRGRKNLTAGKFAEAGKNLFLARLYTFSPVSMLMRAWYFVQSGAIWQPRIIILGAMMIFGYLSAGVGGCAALRSRMQLKAAEEDVDTCKQDLAYAEDMGSNVENFKFDQLAATVTGVRSVGLALQKDAALTTAVKTHARKILDNPDPYAWMYDESNRSGSFADFRSAISKSDKFDEGTKRLLPYIAATRGRTAAKFDRTKDFKETEVCARGPVRLTYRQGKNLGLESVALDAYVGGDASEVAENEVARSDLLGKTAGAALEPASEVTITSAPVTIVPGEQTCVAADGDDDRDNDNKVVRALEKLVGQKSDMVADIDGPYGVVTRIALVYAADLPGAKFADAKKSPIDLRKSLNPLTDAAGGTWVLDRTAELIARSMVLPCEGLLNHEKAKMVATFGEEKKGLPPPIPCLVLNYRLTHDGGG